MQAPNQEQLGLLRQYPRVANAAGNGASYMPTQTSGATNVPKQPTATANTAPNAQSATPAVPNILNNLLPSTASTAPAATAATTPTPLTYQTPNLTQDVGGSTQFNALAQTDPNFLINTANQQGQNAQPAPTGTSLSQPLATSAPTSNQTPANNVPAYGGSAGGTLGGLFSNPSTSAPTPLTSQPQSNLQYPQLQNMLGYGVYTGQGYGL